jgi:outer membrane lipoprotein-sorting protein
MKTAALTMLCTVLALGSLAPAAQAQEFTRAQVLAQLDEKAKVFKSLETSISNTQVVYDFKYPTQSGKFFIKVTNSVPRFLWDITQPKEERKKVLIDKGQGTLYFPNSNTYRQQPVDPKGEVLQLLMIGFGVPSSTLTRNYKAEAKGREKIGDVQAVVLELTSISALTAKFPKLTLWLDPQTWTPVQTRITEKSGDFTDFRYSNIRLNKNLSDSVFNLKIPGDAKKQ